MMIKIGPYNYEVKIQDGLNKDSMNRNIPKIEEETRNILIDSKDKGPDVTVKVIYAILTILRSGLLESEINRLSFNLTSVIYDNKELIQEAIKEK